jgi:glycosyltransferase involved in cell wall biosynthesis
MVLVGTAYPLRGGIAQFNTALVQTLRRRGHDVRVLTFTRQYPSLFFPGKTQKEEGSVSEEIDVGAEPLVDSIGPLSWWRASRRIRQFDPDVVFFKYWMPFFAPCFGTISRWVRGERGPRIVYICDNIVPHERRPLDSLLTRYFVSSGDAFIVMSEVVKEDLLQFQPRAEVRLIPHPVYEHFGSPIPKEEARRRLVQRGLNVGEGDGPLLLFFGIIRPYKGLDILLKAMPGIVRTTGARLIVAGEFYSGREETLKLVDELDLRPHVTVVDSYIPTEDVALYVSASSVVVLPYRSATQSGIVQVAYQLDCPVIATDVGGLSEMIRHGETGLLVPPEDPKTLGETVTHYLESGMESTMREAVRREKAAFSWDRMAEALEELARTTGKDGNLS